jgi:hypothetical protein
MILNFERIKALRELLTAAKAEYERAKLEVKIARILIEDIEEKLAWAEIG